MDNKMNSEEKSRFKIKLFNENYFLKVHQLNFVYRYRFNEKERKNLIIRK